MLQLVQDLVPFLLHGAVSHGRWHPGLGDPTIMGWATTAGYFIAGILCARRAWVVWRDPALRGRQFRFWLFCALIMIALSVNKQLDLQTWFTQFGRRMAKSEGWYRERRTVQVAFIVGLGLAGIALLGYALWFIRGARFQYFMALTGLTFTGCFVVVRAASMHHTDRFLATFVAGVKVSWVLELAGIFVVAAAALFSDRPAARG